MEKKYSVLMSVYYKETPAFLQESIESMLRQTVFPDDFVIVCDGPLPEELWNVLQEFQKARPGLFQIVPLKTCQGLGNALNQGLSYCKNERIARMDSDDISMPERCEKQLLAMDREQADILSGSVYEFEGSLQNIRARRTLPQTAEEIRTYAQRRNPFNHPCVMYRKSAVQAAGGYRHCPFFEDYDLWARMLLLGKKGYNLAEPILYMRAGESMYARRGGISYGCLALKFRWKLKKMGISSTADFFVAGLGQFLVCLLPNKLRKIFYKKVLRKEGDA